MPDQINTPPSSALTALEQALAAYLERERLWASCEGDEDEQDSLLVLADAASNNLSEVAAEHLPSLLRLAATREQEARDMEARLKFWTAHGMAAGSVQLIWRNGPHLFDDLAYTKLPEHDGTPEGRWSATLAALDQAREAGK